MKNNLKKELRRLLSNNEKKPFLIAYWNEEKPGIYDVHGKEYNETEFKELSSKYEHVTVLKFVTFNK